MPNFLEQLVSEWFEFRRYFVRRNVKVGPLPHGGWESELDVVAFNPETRHLVHIEPSMDALSWDRREERYAAKFAAGRKHIRSLFAGLELPEPDQIALLVFAGAQEHTKLGSGRVMLIQELMDQIRFDPKWGLANRSIRNRAVPEQYVILRSLQFAANYWKSVPVA